MTSFLLVWVRSASKPITSYSIAQAVPGCPPWQHNIVTTG